MKLINLTPHDITLKINDNEFLTIPPSGKVARVSSTPGKKLDLPLMPVDTFGPSSFGEVEDLPSVEAGTGLIVSSLVAAQCTERRDVFSPGTGPHDGAIRERGRIVAITRLIRAFRN